MGQNGATRKVVIEKAEITTALKLVTNQAIGVLNRNQPIPAAIVFDNRR